LDRISSINCPADICRPIGQRTYQVPAQQNSYKELITFVSDRVEYDRHYAIDFTKIETELGWKADEKFNSGIIKIDEWHLNKYELKKLL
jgi:dTDP-D-glucose 4,6-dehydratase